MDTKPSNCAACPFDTSMRICRAENCKHSTSSPTITKKKAFDATLPEYYFKDGNYPFARNAALQTEILNKDKTEFNNLLGL